MSGEVWSAFRHDPRDQAYAALRASDADREVVTSLLSTAYGDGRLDREEFEQRSDDAAAARTLGDLPPLVADLVPERSLVRPKPDALVAASPAALDAKALETWQERRRAATFGFLGPTLICWAVYIAYAGLEFDGFAWPMIVMIVTGLNLVRTLASREEILRDERRKLEKQQAKALRKRDWQE